MAVWERIKALNPQQFYCLFRAFIINPFYIIPTYKATLETIEICNKLFGKSHHHNNPSNAFRHALWNYQICERCFPITKSEEKTLAWSQRITDLHEKLFQNEILAEAMDLHNNRIGRILFSKNLSLTIDPVEVLKIKMNQAVKIKRIEDFESAGHQMVYLEKLKVENEK